MSQTIEQEGISIEKMFGRIKTAAALSIAGFSAKEFVKEVINVRKEFQSLETSFATLLGDPEKGKKLFQDITKFATSTPMLEKTLAAGAQTMLGFNIEAEKVMTILQQIGDISMGDSQKFQSLTLAFSQASSTGKLMGQDMLQMVNAGFNPLAEISRTTGKSMKELKEDMSNGKISIDMLEDAFKTATSEGGKFNGMLENMSKTMEGAQSNLEGAFQKLFNDLGTKIEKPVVEGTNAATESINWLAENLDSAGTAIAEVVAMYGIYKAACMTVNALNAAQTAGVFALTNAEKIHYAWLLLTEKAQALLNATMLNNPYVLAAMALGALAIGLYNVATAATGAEAAQANFNRTQEEADKKEEEHKQKIDEIINLYNEEAASTAQRDEALRALGKEYIKIFQKYEDEKGHLRDIIGLKRELAELDGKNTVQNYRNQQNQYSRYAAVFRKVRNSGHGTADLTDAEMKLYQEANKKFIDENSWTTTMGSGAKEKAEYFDQMAKSAGQKADKRASQNAIDKFIDGLSSRNDADLKRWSDVLASAKGKKGVVTIPGFGALTQDQISDMLTRVGKQQETRTGKVKDYDYWDTQRKDALKQLKALSDTEAAGKKGAALRKKIAEYNKKLEAYKDTSKKDASSAAKATKQNAQNQQALADAEAKVTLDAARAKVDAEFSARQYEIDAKKASTQKLLEQIELDYEKEKEAIKRGEEDTKAAHEKAARDIWEKQNPNASDKGLTWENAGKKGKTFELTPEEKQMYEQRTKANEAAHTKAIEDIRIQEAQALRDYLQEYGTFQEKKLALAEEYAEKIRKAQSNGERLSLQREFDAKKNEIDTNRLLENIDMASVFGDFGLLLSEPLKMTVDQLRKLTQTTGFKNRSFEEQKTVFDAIEKAEKSLSGLESLDFNGIGNAMVEYNAALSERVRLEGQLAEAAQTLAEADGKLIKARQSGDEAAIELAKHEYDEAEAKYNLLRNDYAAASTKVAESQSKATQSLTMFKSTLEKVDSSIRAIYNGSLKGVWDLLGNNLQSKIGGLVSGGLELQNQFDKMVTALTKSGMGIDAFAGNLQSKLGDVFSTFTDETSLEDAKNAVNKMIGRVFEDTFGDDNKFDKVASKFGSLIGDLLESGAEEGTAKDTAQVIGKTIGELLKNVGKGGEASGNLWGAIIGVILQLLDEFAENGLGRFVETLLSKVGDAVSGILGNLFQDLIPSLARGIGNLVAGIIEGVVNMVSFGAAGSFLTGKDHEEEYNQDLEDWKSSIDANTYAVEQLTKKMSDKSLTPEESQKERDAALSALQGQIASIRGTANKIASDSSNGFLGIGGYSSWYYKRNDEGFDYNRFNNVLAEHGSSTRVNSSEAVLRLSPEDIQILRTYAGQAWADYFAGVDSKRDPNEIKKNLEQIGDLAEKDEEIMDEWYNSLTNMTFDELRNNFKSTLKDMNSDRDAFLDDFEEIMFDALLDEMMSTSGLSKELQEWKTQWGNFIASGNDLSKGEVEELRGQYEDLIQWGMNLRDDAARITGYSNANPYEQDTSSGGWQSMGQETADELNGRFTALQMSGERISEGIVTTIATLTALSATVTENNTTLIEIRNLMITNNAFLEDILSVNKEYYKSFDKKLDKITVNTK